MLGTSETQAGDLLGDQAEQKDDQPAQEEHHGRGRDVQPAVAVRHRPEVGRQRERLKRHEDREEDPQRAEQRHDPQDDQPELDAVAQQLLRALAGRALAHRDRLEANVVAGLGERHRAGRRPRELVRQQVQELEQHTAPHGAEARCQILHLEADQVGAQAIQGAVAQPAQPVLLARAVARPDDQVVGADVLQQPRQVGRVHLAVRVDDHHHVAGRRAHAGLHARAVADVVGPADHARSGRGGHVGGVVARGVVDDDDLGRRAVLAHAADDLSDRLALVHRRDDHADAERPAPRARGDLRQIGLDYGHILTPPIRRAEVRGGASPRP